MYLKNQDLLQITFATISSFWCLYLAINRVLLKNIMASSNFLINYLFLNFISPLTQFDKFSLCNCLNFCYTSVSAFNLTTARTISSHQGISYRGRQRYRLYNTLIFLL